jgi:type IV secretion system protein VirB10
MNDDEVRQEDDEPKYELTPEEATRLDGSGSPGFFNRKKVLIVLCCVLAGTVAIGVIMNTAKSSRKSKSNLNDEYAQARSNASFVNNLRDAGLRNANNREIDPALLEEASYLPKEQEEEDEPLLPPVSFNRQYQEPAPAPYQQPYPQQGYQQQQRNTFYESPLVPFMQGSLFSQGGSQNYQSSQPASQYDDYLNSLNARAASYSGLAQGQGGALQNSNMDFYQSTNNPGAVYGGQFLGEDSLWTGTIIPGVLETSINTNLPGQVLARVTQNIYDSKTGRSLLIPQGSILVARYNSSVSYAQSRVQIIWDVLIRPDGYQINLEGANGVDRAGMSGQDANYKSNFFEYVKAAGIISLFSIANAKLTENVNKFGSETAASNVAESNAQFFNQLGSDLVSQAMNVQPVLTVDSGTLINVMLNKTIYLPRAPGFKPGQKYILE